MNTEKENTQSTRFYTKNEILSLFRNLTKMCVEDSAVAVDLFYMSLCWGSTKRIETLLDMNKFLSYVCQFTCGEFIVENKQVIWAKQRVVSILNVLDITITG